jgi:hypothetical protein
MTEEALNGEKKECQRTVCYLQFSRVLRDRNHAFFNATTPPCDPQVLAECGRTTQRLQRDLGKAYSDDSG